MKDALFRIRKALERNPAFSPFGAVPIANEEKGTGEAGLVEKEKGEKEEATGGKEKDEDKEEREKETGGEKELLLLIC